ncbi:hypothetical protein Tco_0756016 [Tanacetum coccineum]
MPVEKLSTSKKPERLIPKGHRFSYKKTTTVPEKTRTPRSCLRWQPTGRILKTVCLRWVPTGKLLNSCTGKVDSEPAHGSIVDIPHIHACKQTLGLSAGTSFNGQKQQRIDLNADVLHNEKQENLRVCSSSLGHQCLMASAENNTSGPVPQSLNDVCSHQFRPLKFKAGSKSCSLSKQDSYIMTRVGITIPPSHSNAEDNRFFKTYFNHKRVAKQRVAKRRVAKRRVAKQRVAKQRVAKQRVAKQRVANGELLNSETVCLRWVPTGKTFASSTTKVESEPPNGSNADITNQCESKQALNVSAVQASIVNDKWRLLKITLQAPFLNDKMMSVHISSGLVLHQMTSDHNRSELGIQDHSNEQSSSKLVPKVVP